MRGLPDYSIAEIVVKVGTVIVAVVITAVSELRLLGLPDCSVSSRAVGGVILQEIVPLSLYVLRI